jgi:CRP-like cAMP-binding protein
VIVEEGSEGDAFYVIAAGRVEVLRSGETVRELERGETFGEIALLRDTPRTATCRALTDVELLELDRATFVGAVSGDLHSSELAEELVEARLASDAA